MQKNLTSNPHKGFSSPSELDNVTPLFTYQPDNVVKSTRTSIIIPTHNKAEYLGYTLSSLSKQLVRPTEIIVVNDGSTDHTREVLDRFSARIPVRVVHQNCKGRAAARNTGLSTALNDLIIFCDDDRIASPSFVAEHVRAAIASPRSICIGWKRRVLSLWREHLPLTQQEYASISGFQDFQNNKRDHPKAIEPTVSEALIENDFDEFLRLWEIGDEVDNYDTSSPTTSQKLPWMYGTTANLSFNRNGRRDIFFDEKYQGWGVEDTDFCYSLFKQGYDIRSIDRAINYHQVHPLGSKSLRKDRAERMQQANQNLNAFCEKHRSLEAHLYRRIQQGMSGATADSILQHVGEDQSGKLKEEMRQLYALQTFDQESGPKLQSVSGVTLWAHDTIPEFHWERQEGQKRPTPATLLESGYVATATPRVTAAFNQPLTTHKWWTPFLWQADEEIFCDNTFPHPLCMKPTQDGIQLGYPSDVHITPDNSSFFYPFRTDLVIAMVGDLATPRFGVDGYSDWLVDASWETPSATLRMRAGRGMPTTHFWGNVEGAIGIDVRGDSRITRHGSEALIIRIANATYMLCLGSATAEIAENYIEITPILGVIEFALHLLPSDRPDYISMFAQQGTRKPSGSEFSWSVNHETAEIEQTFRLSCEAEDGPNSIGFLQAVYPHQARGYGEMQALGQYESPRGAMTLINTMEFTVKQKKHGFLPYLPSTAGDTEALYREIDELYREHAGQLLWQQPLEGWSVDDGYWAGKALVRLADLAHTSDVVGHSVASEAFIELIKTKLENYLDGMEGAGFYYSSEWSTLLYAPCAVHALSESMNDHVYYYGYFIRAAVAVALRDREWISQPKIRNGLMNIVRDVANNDRNDDAFPFLRCYDVYAGHSWGNGSGAYPQGLNAEPSSESINFAAALTQLGSLLDDENIESLGLMLYAAETSATLDYWLDTSGRVTPPNYPHKFAGMIWGSGVSHRSWFSAKSTETLGVNLLPVQASSVYLARSPGISEILDTIHEEWSETSPRWGGLFCMVEALADPGGAMDRFEALRPEERYEWSLHSSTVVLWMRSLEELGAPVFDESCNATYYTVFDDGEYIRYIVFNSKETSITARFSGGVSLEVPPMSYRERVVESAARRNDRRVYQSASI